MPTPTREFTPADVNNTLSTSICRAKTQRGCTQCLPNGQLRPARKSAGQHQACNIDAAKQKDEKHSGLKQRQACL